MNNLLSVGIGMMLVYLIFAIVVSGAQEWWAQWRRERGKFLLTGILRLVNDDAISSRLLRHPLILGLSKTSDGSKPPSYVDPNNFALALVDVIKRRVETSQGKPADSALTYETLQEAIRYLEQQNSPLAQALSPIVSKAGNDLNAALDGIQKWFSGGMDRVSGWYKASSQRSMLAIGFAIAAVANVDTIEIYQALDRSPDLAAQLAAQAETITKSGHIGSVDLTKIDTTNPSPQDAQTVLKAVLAAPGPRLPIGYDCLSAAAVAPTAGDSPAKKESDWNRCVLEFKHRSTSWSGSTWLVHILGWFLTAVAGTLGAPYWFSALSRIVGLRGSGPAPVKPTSPAAT